MPPAWIVADVSIITVKAGDKTSSPGLTPAAIKAACKVEVPELKVTACLEQNFSENVDSSVWFQFPAVDVQFSEFKTFSK